VSVLRDIADALAESLAEIEYDSVDTQPAVSRLNWPQYEIEQLQDPVIAVTPGTVTVTRVDRTRHQYDYAVNAFVGRHTPNELDADEMLELAEEIVDVIREHDWDEEIDWPEGVTSPMELEVTINPDEALQERNVWRAVITATYRVFR
jgi:predicted P-loop ATPase/GTPase